MINKKTDDKVDLSKVKFNYKSPKDNEGKELQNLVVNVMRASFNGKNKSFRMDEIKANPLQMIKRCTFLARYTNATKEQIEEINRLSYKQILEIK